LSNTDASEECNWLAIRKVLKEKRVTSEITPHLQQNDECSADPGRISLSNVR